MQFEQVCNFGTTFEIRSQSVGHTRTAWEMLFFAAPHHGVKVFISLDKTANYLCVKTTADEFIGVVKVYLPYGRTFYLLNLSYYSCT